MYSCLGQSGFTALEDSSATNLVALAAEVEHAAATSSNVDTDCRSGLALEQNVQVVVHRVRTRDAQADRRSVGALNGRVVALSRLSGRLLATLPAPPDGFLLPFTLRVKAPGRLVILDSGGFPSPTMPA